MSYSTDSSNISYHEALTDIETRFLLNLPEEELSKIDRLLFWIQEAHWFYDDFYCDNNASLPRLTFKAFTKEIFNHCPLFSGMKNNVDNIISYYRQYKSEIPVCGCILLTPNMSKLLLVCNWNGKSWTFPRGKLNENEDSIDCAIREVYEETGFDISQYIDREELHQIESDDGNIKLFIVPNVAEDTYFEPQTRKEISDVKFFPINTLPSDNFAVKQFIKPLKNWISQQKKRRHSFDAGQLNATKSQLKSSNYNKNIYNKDTFHGDDSKKWSVDQMFAANASITGRNYDAYDGNPHDFGSQHPRYVDYNSDNTSSIRNQRDRQNTASSLGDEFDLNLMAMQSNQFHSTRKVSISQEYEEMQLEEDRHHMSYAEKGKDSVNTMKNRSKSSSASDKLATKIKNVSMISSLSTKTSSSSSSAKVANPAIKASMQVASTIYLLPEPFRFNRDAIMDAFDKAWKI